MPRPAPPRPGARPHPARPTALAAVLTLALALLAALPATRAAAVAPPLANPRILSHFSLADGQMPENIVLEPAGTAVLTFIGARQVVRVDTATGEIVQVLATLPAPPGNTTPVVGVPAVTGLARADDGTLYFSYATGTSDLTGIWRLRPGGTARRIVELPVDSLPNGLALDERAGVLYSADSALGLVRRIPLDGGEPTVWAGGAELEPTGFIGANGLRWWRGAVWVSNTDRGTLLRYPVLDDGSAGPVEVRAEDLPGIDDFTFPNWGGHDHVLAALNPRNEVAHITPEGEHTIVLTQQDGLASPSSVAVCGRSVYVTDAAFAPGQEPNLLLAELTGE